MLETHFRKGYQKVCVDPLLNLGILEKVHPHFFTCFACILGISLIPLLAYGFSFTALAMLGISGFLDTVDGSLARRLKIASSKGAALDIVCDRIVEFSIIIGLYTVDPYARGLPALIMLGSVLVCVTSFLIVGVFTEKDSEKSFYYSPGLIERAEAFIAFALMILFSSAFTFSAYIFSFLVFVTTAVRMHQFLRHHVVVEVVHDPDRADEDDCNNGECGDKNP